MRGSVGSPFVCIREHDAGLLHLVTDLQGASEGATQLVFVANHWGHCCLKTPGLTPLCVQCAKPPERELVIIKKLKLDSAQPL